MSYPYRANLKQRLEQKGKDQDKPGDISEMGHGRTLEYPKTPVNKVNRYNVRGKSPRCPFQTRTQR